MHLLRKYLTDTAEQTTLMQFYAKTEPPFGGGFTIEQAEQADKMEIWGSGFNDIGDDFCDYKLFKNNEVIENKRVTGY